MEYRKTADALTEAREKIAGPRVIRVRRAPEVDLFDAADPGFDTDATEPYDLEVCAACREPSADDLCDACHLAVNDPDAYAIEIREGE